MNKQPLIQKLLFLFKGIAVISMLMVSPTSCSCDREKNKNLEKLLLLLGSVHYYKLTVISENGTVEISPNKTEYREGETVTLTPTPSDGYDFATFNEYIDGYGRITIGGKNHTYVMDRDRVVTAVFVPIPSTTPVYYIDYDNGLDTNEGTSETAPWKHAPEDSNATGVPAATSLTPGAELRFKGGVIYRGSVVFKDNESGSLNYPIKLSGNSWPSGTKAVLDGGTLIPNWTRCSSAADCRGNENYANIYYATITGEYEILDLNLHELNPVSGENEFVWMSQCPVPTDDRQYFHETAPKYVPDSYTMSSITDADIFNQADPAYWNDAYLLIWVANNLVEYRKITSFNPATDTVCFDAVDTTYFNDYAIYNSTKHIASPGKYSAVASGPNEYKIFIWPRNSTGLDSRISVSTLHNAIEINKSSNLTIDGFLVRAFAQTAVGTETASYVPKGNITIRNCRLEHNYSGAAVYLDNVSHSLIENNEVIDNRLQTGISVVESAHAVIRDNTVSRCGWAGIRLYTDENVEVLHNTILRCNGTHSNGVSIYLGCHNILFANNRLFDNESSIAMQRSGNVYLINNLIDGEGINEWVQDLSGEYPARFGDIMLLNNTSVMQTVFLSQNIRNNHVFVNNIIPGFEADDPAIRHNNLYTDTTYGFTDETIVTDMGIIFRDISAEDYSLKTGSPAIQAGYDIGLLLPADFTARFPEFDYTRDIDGRPRSGWDLGAFSYVPY